MITQSRLKELIHYEPITGIFTRLVRTSNRVKIGDVIGSKHCMGYLEMTVGGHRCLSHRVAWLYIFGKLPDQEIDHINGVKTDNRIANLREATHAENMRNMSRHSDGVSGVLGVSLHKKSGKWKAQCSYGGVNKHLGLFADKECAIETYNSFADTHKGGFHRVLNQDNEAIK